MSIKEKVDRGVAWLDKYHPGWKDKINSTIFNINKPSKCVLSQVFDKNYWDIQKILSHKFCLEYGFTSEPVDTDNLQKEWESHLIITYDLSKELVGPGEYIISKVLASSPHQSLFVGNKVTVLEQVEQGERKNYCVLNGSNKLFINILAEVYESKESS